MRKLQKHEYERARSIFRDLADFHLAVETVLAGTVPGEIWVNDAQHPRVSFMSAADGHFLTGDVDQERSYSDLKATIPPVAYLKFSPPQWEEKLPEVWVNRIARPFPRCYFRLHTQKMPDWRERVPQNFRVVPINADLVGQRDLKNLDIVTKWMEDWFSPEDFFQHGFGFCLIRDRTIASVCMTDCVCNQRCEIGIKTVPEYRRQGLAAIAVAATVEYAVAHDVTSIGWHCLRSNTGSIAVAEKVGFMKVKDYCAYATSLPAENTTDLPPAEWQKWAEYYE
jgi:RimJ/RimL family protein N-acetyltransferase